MVDREKVKLMTQAAMVETQHSEDTYVAANFYASDFISYQIIRGLFGVTMLFLGVFGVWVIYHFEALTTAYRLTELYALGKRILALYIISVAAGVSLSILINMKKYFRAKDSLRSYREALRSLNKLYRKESGE